MGLIKPTSPHCGKWTILSVLLLVLLCYLQFCVQVSGFLTTQVKLAPGTFITGLVQNGYDTFFGVPFARPPVGNLRFRVLFYSM